jgi:hypothetical protein
MQFDLPELIYEGKPALPPQQKDLERLYGLIVKHRATTVLEFGCGYSTIIIQKALGENEWWYGNLKDKPKIRNPNLWECHSVEVHETWIKEVKQHTDWVIFHNTSVHKVYLEMRICHEYHTLPKILPDFIYIDGPDPFDVWPINMPMSADLIRIEPLLIPGTVVVIDGRVNNARFLQRNLQRDWSVRMENDVTIMELDEPRLGKINACGRDLREAVGE